MITNAEKSLELIIQVERLNQGYKVISEKIGKHTNDCWESKLSINSYPASVIEPCLMEWLERKFEVDHNFCPVTGREYEIKRPYWTAPQMTERDCPHCYKALQLIGERKELRKIRGRIKAKITKLAKREIGNRVLNNDN